MKGIYKFTNKINNKVYIGKSQNLLQRYQSHKRNYNNSKLQDYNTKFYRALRKYGFENFDVKILGEFKKELLYKIVESFIEQYNTVIPNGYNIHGEAISSRFND